VGESVGGVKSVKMRGAQGKGGKNHGYGGAWWGAGAASEGRKNDLPVRRKGVWTTVALGGDVSKAGGGVSRGWAARVGAGGGGGGGRGGRKKQEGVH